MDVLVVADASFDVQLAGVMAATIVETWTHGILQKGGRLRARCGAIGIDMLQGSIGAQSMLRKYKLGGGCAHLHPHVSSAAPVPHRVCPGKGFRGVVDESLVKSSMDAGYIALELNDRAAASSTWELKLPALSEHRFSKVEDLQNVSTEDKYLRPPKSFPAIDSIAIVGGTAYLVQITQDLKHDINVGLLSVLACLPSPPGREVCVGAAR